jgi:hypothetical protein
MLSSDVLSSAAYATEELLAVLALGEMAALKWSMPVTTAIVALPLLLVISCAQDSPAFQREGYRCG